MTLAVDMPSEWRLTSVLCVYMLEHARAVGPAALPHHFSHSHNNYHCALAYLTSLTSHNKNCQTVMMTEVAGWPWFVDGASHGTTQQSMPCAHYAHAGSSAQQRA
jgi:hypothetical protein